MSSSLRRLLACFLATGIGMASQAADVAGSGAKDVAAKAPALSKQRHEVIMSNLDAGGDLLVVANMDGWVRDAVRSISKPIMAIGADEPDFKPVATFLEKLPGYLDKNGFYGFQGLGVSVVPRADGQNNIKCFIARDPEVTWSPLWKAMVGGNPSKMACTDFLTVDTEMARTGTEEYGALWKMVRSGVADLCTPETAAAFNAQLSGLATNMGVNLDKMFESMGGEGFVAIQFSKTETITIPGTGSQAPVKMAKPGVLIGVAVKDDTLVKSLEAAVKKSGMLSVTNVAGGIKVVNIPFPMPPYVPLQPAYAMHGGFFLLGSTPATLAAGIKAFDTKTGLASTPEFKKAFEGLPMVNNGISYMSPRFMNTILDVQKALIARDPGEGAKMAGMMDDMMGWRRNMSAAQVFLNKRNGVLVTGTSSAGAKEMVASVMIAPFAMLAGIAIPSVMTARTMSQANVRSMSQENVCVNNLRMMEAAKEQWALVNKKDTGAEVKESDIIQYLGEGKMPKCPQGGTYSLETIGTNARCSHPGHELTD